MKVLQLILTGLFTDPASPTSDEAVDALKDCGMLKTAEAIRDQHPEHEHVIEAFSWDGNKNPDANCRVVLALIQAEKPDVIFVHAHSFGNDLALFLFNWLAFWHPDLKVKVNFFFAYDPCRNPFFGAQAWSVNPATVLDWHSWFQHNKKPWGVSGTAFYDPAGGHNTDVTAWGDGHVTQDGYIGVPDDDRIRNEVYDFARPIITVNQAVAGDV